MPITLAIQGFRSLSDDSRLRLSTGINILVGPNNSGKSNLLRAIALILAPGGRTKILSSLDYAPATREVRIKLRIDELDPFLDPHKDRPYVHLLTSMLRRYASAKGPIELEYRITNEGQNIEFENRSITSNLIEVMREDRQTLYQLWNQMTSQSGGGPEQHWAPQLVMPIFDILKHHQRRTKYLDSTRYITDGTEIVHASSAPIMSERLKANEIVDLLFRLQNPRIGDEKDREKFEAIQEFMRDVTNNDTLTIDVSHDRSTINIAMDGRRLPLSNLGSGIEQLLIMATFAISFSNEAILIDEPELHIHPLLQRKLMRFLANTGQQFFITTHSPSIIDAVPATIHRVQLVNGQTIATSVDFPHERFEIVSELGYRPSDLVQTNFIVWVEGPSDRIYINSWLQSLDNELVEGIDYAFMFYGGKVLSHFEVGGDTERELIDVLTINRRGAIFMDRDRASADEPLNTTKQRIIAEAQSRNMTVVVSPGREIENSLSRDIYKAALAEMGYTPAPYGLFNDLMTVRVEGKKVNVDKIKFAHKAVSLEPAPSDELIERPLREIIQEIRRASLRDI